jgi:hypothetical protein
MRDGKPPAEAAEHVRHFQPLARARRSALALLSNLVLDDLDKELTRRGHCFLPVRGRLQHLYP